MQQLDFKYINLRKPNTLVDFEVQFKHFNVDSCVGPFERINLLIGANNSRKSRFVRALCKEDNFILRDHPIELNLWYIDDALAKYIELMPDENHIHIKYNESEISDYYFQIANPQDERLKFLYDELRKKSTIRIDKARAIELRDAIGKVYEETTLASFTKCISDVRRFTLALWFTINETSYSRWDAVRQRLIHYYRTDSFKNYINTEEKIAAVGEILSSLERQVSDFYAIEVSPVKYLLPANRMVTRLFNTNGGTQKLYINESTFTESYVSYHDIKLSDKLKVFTGQDIFSIITALRAGTSADRKAYKEFETFVSSSFFQNAPIEIVAKHGTQDILFNLNDQERFLHEIGDGIQSIIQLMLPLFTAPQDAWIFIEEPELHLHPGFITLFMNTLLRNPYLISKRNRFFVTTHSNHLLDLSITKNKGISIFTFEENRETKKSKIKNVMNRDLSILDTLGATNSSVFMAKTALWVEGHTDRMIIEAYLRAYERSDPKITKYIPDYDYSFFEYAGANNVHYIFSEEATDKEQKRIKAYLLANRIWMLADQDGSPHRQKRHAELSAMSTKGFVYKTTIAREIENTVGPKLIRLILTKLLKADASKVQRMKIDSTKYHGEKLGAYLKKKVGDTRRESGMEEKGLTAKMKHSIAKLIVEAEEKGELKWEDDNWITEDGRAIIHSLHKFLQDNIPSIQ